LTFAHEIGHALGQAHIMGLYGISSCSMSAGNSGNDDACYGRGVWQEIDETYYTNIMGGGDRLAAINAISWTQRMADHCPDTKCGDWEVSLNYHKYGPEQVT